MTTYNSYEAAKIANPESNIYEFKGYLSSFKGIGSKKCNPADHCVRYDDFLNLGHKFVDGDAFLNRRGEVVIITNAQSNNRILYGDESRFILRAAALENIPTETPEEKEVLDGIESVGEVGWKNGDDVDAYGKPYKYVGLDPFNENLCICLANQDDDPQCFSIDVLKKPETPHHREEREQLEAGYELYKTCGIQHETVSFNEWVDDYKDVWLNIVDKTNYRKEKSHGTN